MAGILDDKQLFVQTCLYFLLIPLGLMVAVPVCLNTRAMNGYCLMYARILTLEDHKVDFEPGVRADCDFTVAVNVIFAMFYALVIGIIHAIGIRANVVGTQGMEGNPLDFVQGPIVNAVFLAGNVLGAVFNFVASCIFSAGMSRFCDTLSEAALQEENPLTDCADGQLQIDWTISNAGDGSSYYAHMATALMAQWMVFIVFLFHIALNGLTVLKQIKARRGDDAHDNATLMIINALRNRSQRASEVKGRSTEVRANTETNGESHNATMHRFYLDIKHL